MFTLKDYNYIKMNTQDKHMTVEEFSSLLNTIQKEYGLTRNEAYEVLEQHDDIVEQIIERRGMDFEVT